MSFTNKRIKPWQHVTRPVVGEANENAEPFDEEKFNKNVQKLSSEEHVSVHLARRVLAVRKGDVARAVSLLQNYKSLDSKYKLSAVKFSDIKAFLQNERLTTPYNGDAPVSLMVFNAKYHTIGSIQFADEIRIVTWLLNDLSRRDGASNPAIGLVLVINLEGAGFNQMDTQLLSELLNLLQDHLPARVHRVLICNAPWWASLVLQLVFPFLKAKLVEKVKLVSSPDEIFAVVPERAVPKYLGGKLQYSHSQWLQLQENKLHYEDIETTTLESVDLSSSSQAQPQVQEVAIEM